MPEAQASALIARFAGGRHARGQYFTPPPLAQLVAALAIRTSAARVLEPAAGTGALLEAAARRLDALRGGGQDSGRVLVAHEPDPDLAAIAARRCPSARIEGRSFFEAPPPPGSFDAVIGNPPFTRQHHLESVATGGASALARTVEQQFGVRVPRRASAYVHFVLAGLAMLRPGGRLAMIVPSTCLDVASAASVRDAELPGGARLIAIVEPTADRWFDSAQVNAVILVYERPHPGQQPAREVRLVGLERPLAELDCPVALAASILGGSGAPGGVSLRALPHERLASARWGRLLRAPGIVCELEPELGALLVPLSELCQVRRGLTTGANEFFYLDSGDSHTDLPAGALMPLLKSPRDLACRRVHASELEASLLALAPDSCERSPAIATLVRAGESRGLHERSTCRARPCWFVVKPPPPPALVLAKGVWDRWVAASVSGAVAFDQQLYGLYPRPGVDPPRLEALWGLLGTAWTMIQAELAGRTGFGDGVLWLAAYEIESLPVLDVRRLDDEAVDRLAALARALANEPVTTRAGSLASPGALALETEALVAGGLEPDRAGAGATGLVAAAVELSRARMARASRSAIGSRRHSPR